MLVADQVRGGPVVPRVGVRSVGAHDAAPAAELRIERVVPPLQLVHALEVELERALLAVDLDVVAVLVAGGEARGLEGRDRTLLEAREEEHRVVDGRLARLLAARTRLRALAGDLAARVRDDRALLDEGLLDRAHDLGHLVAGDEARHVDDVRVEVAMRARTREITLEAPQQRRVWPAPVLQVRRAHVEDAPEAPLLDQPVRERHRGAATIVVPDEGAHALLGGGARGEHHLLRVGERAGERLLARDMLAGLEARDRHLGVEMVRRRDIDELDLGVREQVLPVHGRVLPAPLGGERGGFRGVATRDHAHRGRALEVEELRALAPRGRVRAAHELGADQRDPDRASCLRGSDLRTRVLRHDDYLGTAGVRRGVAARRGVC